MPLTDKDKRKAYAKRYYESHREKWVKKAETEEEIEKRKAYHKQWYSNNKEHVRAFALNKKHGTDGVELYVAQQGCCAICRIDLSSLGSKYQHIDHCHTTHTIRGLLCQWCNQGLGNFRDSPEALRNAATYLENHKKGDF